MAHGDLQQKLVAYIQDTHALEQNVLNMLDSMIRNTDDPQMKTLLQQHRGETVQHEQRLRQRLEQLGQSRSVTAEAGAIFTSFAKGLGDMLRGDKPGKNLRDGFVTEHVEIAAYELLERLANRAGDKETAAICRQNKAEEYEMARRLGGYWDRAIDLTLLEAGIEYDANGTRTGSFGERADAAERGKTWTGSSAEADMGIGVHGTRTTTETGWDQEQGRVPGPEADATRSSDPTVKSYDVKPGGTVSERRN